MEESRTPLGMTIPSSTHAIRLPSRVVERCSQCSALATVEERMRLTLELAELNIGCRGGPFAATVFDARSGQLIAAGVNRVLAARNSLAHAEMLAIMLAEQRLGVHDLASHGGGEYQLVTTAKPCVQCFGAVWWSGLRSLVISASGEDVERITGFREGPLPPDWAHALQDREPLPSVAVHQDVLREAGRQVLESYVAQGGPIYNPGGPEP